MSAEGDEESFCVPQFAKTVPEPCSGPFPTESKPSSWRVVSSWISYEKTSQLPPLQKKSMRNTASKAWKFTIYGQPRVRFYQFVTSILYHWAVSEALSLDSFSRVVDICRYLVLSTETSQESIRECHTPATVAEGKWTQHTSNLSYQSMSSLSFQTALTGQPW